MHKLEHLRWLTGGTSYFIEPLSKGNKVDGLRKPRRRNATRDVLSTILTSIADNHPNQEIQGVDAYFIPQISIDKMKLEVMLTFPFKGDVDTKKLYNALKKLGTHASGSSEYNPVRSLIHGGDAPKGYHADDPEGWYRSMKRLPEYRHSVLIKCRKQARRFKPNEHPRLPGKYAGYWPEYPRNAKGQLQLPPPLHTCHSLRLDCVEEIIKGAEENDGAQFLRATFTLILNPNRALAHHSFMGNASLTDEQVVQAFFPNPAVEGEHDNFCDPAISQTAIVQAIKNTIDATMSLLYADLHRALTHVPELPLAETPPESWQEALEAARLSLVEVDRHLRAEDAPRAFSELKQQLSTWRSNYRARTHGSKVGETEKWNSSVDNEATSISTTLRQGNGRTSAPASTVIVYKKRINYLRMELRLREHNGICYNMPTIPRGKKHKPILMVDGNAYVVPSRSNTAGSLDELVDMILWVMITSQEEFQRLLGKLDQAPHYTEVQLSAFIESLSRVVTKKEEQPALTYITSTLRERQPLRAGIAGDANVDRVLRRLGDRKLFRYKGGQKTRRYYPNIPPESVPTSTSSLVGEHKWNVGSAQAPPTGHQNTKPLPGPSDAQGKGRGLGTGDVVQQDPTFRAGKVTMVILAPGNNLTHIRTL